MNDSATHRIPQSAEGSGRPALVVVRLDDRRFDTSDAVVPVMGSLCGIDDPGPLAAAA